jgi:fermentation-respiration switch protein FrsA (DUF1100 family)
MQTHEWVELGRKDGVTLRATGSGPALVLFPGMEGSGESCVHLAEPVALPGHRLVLVDYASEKHRFLGALTGTIAALIAAHVDTSDLAWWGQSFGNILLGAVQQMVGSPAKATILVSPFTSLPMAPLRIVRPLIAVTPRPLYATTSPLISRYLFGPAPSGAGKPFFDALQRMTPLDLRRRTGWLAHADLAGAFLPLAGPLGVWFGEEDRLVDRSRQFAFFTALTRRNGKVSVLDGCGHVVLPPNAVTTAREEIADWLREK